MKQLKKTLLTLVALIAVTTGAWAEDVLNLVVDGTSATIKYDGNASNNPILSENGWRQNGNTWDVDYTNRSTITTVTIDGSCKNFSGTTLRSLFNNFSVLTTINGLENLNTATVQNMAYMFANCSKLTSLDLSSLNTASLTTMFYMFGNCSELTTVDLSGWNTAKLSNTGSMFCYCSKLENIYVGDGWSTAAVTSSGDMFTDCTKLLSMNTANPATDKTNAHTGDGGYLKVKPAGTPVPLTWDATAKTATLTNGMPAGNVTVSVDYFAQAEFAMSTGETPGALAPTAIDGVPANTDGAIVEAGTVANIGTTDVKQGTLMYFVKQVDGNTAPTAPTYDTDGWTDKVPTADGLAQGKAYVWYYIEGAEPTQGTDRTDDNTRSDSDIKPLGTIGYVTLEAEPTYSVTLNDEGLSTDEAAAWKVAKGTEDPAAFPLEGVKKSETVTVTYTGTRKVIGVKAEKTKAAAEATAEDKDKLICTKGHIHAYGEDAECTAARVAKIIYIGDTDHGTYNHGLALALTDETSTMRWQAAIDACSAKNTSTPVTGATWLLASKAQWGYMMGTDGAGSYTALRTGFSSVGGSDLSDDYWSSTEYDSDSSKAWEFYFVTGKWGQDSKTSSSYPVRACLAF